MLLWCLGFPFITLGQAKRAQNLIEKEKYESAYELLLKSTTKDSLASAEKYVLSTLFMLDSFPSSNIDSAYAYILNGLDDLSKTDDKILGRLEKDDFNKKTFTQQKQHIEAVAFAPAKAEGTESAYIIYLKKYPTALQTDSAITFRNADAYKQAAQQHTYESYQAFFDKYPKAKEVPEAREHYELLLFEHFTRSGKLASFVDFLTDYPNTPYRANCERQIFIITTGTNQPSDYLQFISNYPSSYLVNKAIDMLFHQSDPDSFMSNYSNLTISDSLKTIITQRQETLILVPNEDIYQYINLDNQVIVDDISWIANSFKCEPAADYILAAKGDIKGVYSTKGQLISEGNMTSAKDVGAGFILVVENDKSRLVHKSGALFGQIEHNELQMAFPYVIYRDQSKWGMKSITGLPILGDEYDTIFSAGNNIVLKAEGKMGVFPDQAFTQALDGGSLQFDLNYDIIELFNEEYLLIINQEQEGLLNYNLEPIVPLAEQTIELINHGYFIDRGDSIYNSTYDGNQWFTEITANRDWSLARTTTKIHVKYLDKTAFEADDVALIGSLGLLLNRNDSLFLMLTDTTSLFINKDQSISAIPMLSTSDESSHYSVTTKGKKLPDILDRYGKKIKLPRYIRVHDLGEGFLLVQTKKEYIVYDNQGKALLKGLDGASSLGDGLISVFADRQFGLFSLKDSVDIPLVYSKHLQKISDTLFIAKQGDQMGVINGQNKKVLPFRYSDITVWNDSLVFVSIGYRLAIVNLNTRRTLVDQLSGWEPMYENEEASIIKILRNAQYGIFGNKSGLMLDATFSDISNIGTELAPVYLAEKYIDEAELYILLYYNQDAELFKKLVLSAEQYEALQCNREEL